MNAGELFKQNQTATELLRKGGGRAEMYSLHKASLLLSPFYTFKIVICWKCGTETLPYCASIYTEEEKKTVCQNLIDRVKLFLHAFVL